MKKLLLAGAALSLLAVAAPPARSQVTATVVSGNTCPVGQTILNVGNNRPLVETQDGQLCVGDGNNNTALSGILANTNSMTSSLTALQSAAAAIPPQGSTTGACKVLLAVPGTFYGASGNVNAASTIFILNKAADPGTGTVAAADLIVAPLTAGAAGFWSVSTIQPVTATVGVTVCVSSTLYSAGVLTKTNVTSTNATNNTISGLAQ